MLFYYVQNKIQVPRLNWAQEVISFLYSLSLASYPVLLSLRILVSGHYAMAKVFCDLSVLSIPNSGRQLRLKVIG